VHKNSPTCENCLGPFESSPNPEQLFAETKIRSLRAQRETCAGKIHDTVANRGNLETLDSRLWVEVIATSESAKINIHASDGTSLSITV
jgi:hypothetical protein